MDNVVTLTELSNNNVLKGESIEVRVQSPQLLGTKVFKRCTSGDLQFSEFLTKEKQPTEYSLLSEREHKVSPLRKFFRDTKDYFSKPVAKKDGTDYTKFDMLLEKNAFIQFCSVAVLGAMLYACYILGACIVPIG